MDQTSDMSLRPGSDGWLPIREVARQTGVNPVTLRAWERRYGLIVPLRTGKGHRLYSAEHVQRIRDILAWLNRGVAVGQIKQLLERQQSVEQIEPNPWRELREQMLAAVERLSERQLDDAFNRALTVYPPRTLCQHLLLPLRDALAARWQGQFGAALEQVLFESWLRNKVAMRLYHSNRQQAGAPLLCASLGAQPVDLGLWLSAWLASASAPVEVVERSVPLAELGLALERLQPRALLLHAEHGLDKDCLQRQLPRLARQLDAGLLLVGPAVLLQRAELTRQGLLLAEGPLQALEKLALAGLLATDPEQRP
ncbi:MerR family transcriptional regulator [Pseudomonas oligotrophica]|uniref:MerR family transcriptional regulator n=1 Tax=Pseudomonas oligotrophica TaxID=2912055 RepID=UPI001EFFBBAC|nr:MerR family transcriptional regulator [Pseudomonas oligotrophica]MCF7202581.1 MerR family transcriptional regulator [Pseudomonas oligotrophica]